MQKKKTSYAADLVKGLFQPHNLPTLVYLCVNFVLGYVGALFLPRLAEDICTDVQAALPVQLLHGTPYYLAVLGGVLAVYILIFSLSLCPIGEWILRIRLHCRKIKSKEISEKIEPLFDEVYQKARTAAPSIAGNIRLYMQKGTQANAFAVGRKSVCVTGGLLELPAEEIQGVLAHEFAHLAHKDTGMNLAVNISGGMTNFVMLALWLAYLLRQIVRFCLDLFASNFDLNALEGPIASLIFAAVAIFVVRILQNVWTALGNLLLMITSRSREYKADIFACNLGYARGLLDFFYRLPDAEAGSKNKLKRFVRALGRIGATHPATWKRIENIRKYYEHLAARLDGADA